MGMRRKVAVRRIEEEYSPASGWPLEFLHFCEANRKPTVRPASFEPLGTRQTLALGTAAVAAGVVGVTCLLAVAALFDVTAQRSRAARSSFAISALPSPC
jgi:hypothetical protein